MRGRARRSLILLLVVSATAGATANAHSGPSNQTHLLFEAAVPCGLACPRFQAAIDSACAQPLVPGSYDSFITTPAPTPPPGTIAVLEAALDMAIDWDLYLCSLDGDLLDEGATQLDEPCDYNLGTSPILNVGCHEDVDEAVIPGQQVVVRAFNVADVGPGFGRYWFTFVPAPAA